MALSYFDTVTKELISPKIPNNSYFSKFATQIIPKVSFNEMESDFEPN